MANGRNKTLKETAFFCFLRFGSPSRATEWRKKVSQQNRMRNQMKQREQRGIAIGRVRLVRRVFKSGRRSTTAIGRAMSPSFFLKSNLKSRQSSTAALGRPSDLPRARVGPFLFCLFVCLFGFPFYRNSSASSRFFYGAH